MARHGTSWGQVFPRALGKSQDLTPSACDPVGAPPTVLNSLPPDEPGGRPRKAATNRKP